MLDNIVIPRAIHGRLAQKIVFGANALDSEIYLEKDNRRINLGSILGLLSLNLQENDEVRIAVRAKTPEIEERDLKMIKELITEKS